MLGGSFEAVHDEIDSWCFLVRFRSFFFGRDEDYLSDDDDEDEDDGDNRKSRNT